MTFIEWAKTSFFITIALMVIIPLSSKLYDTFCARWGREISFSLETREEKTRYLIVSLGVFVLLLLVYPLVLSGMLPHEIGIGILVLISIIGIGVLFYFTMTNWDDNIPKNMIPSQNQNFNNNRYEPRNNVLNTQPKTNNKPIENIGIMDELSTDFDKSIDELLDFKIEKSDI